MGSLQIFVRILFFVLENKKQKQLSKSKCLTAFYVLNIKVMSPDTCQIIIWQSLFIVIFAHPIFLVSDSWKTISDFDPNEASAICSWAMEFKGCVHQYPASERNYRYNETQIKTDNCGCGSECKVWSPCKTEQEKVLLSCGTLQNCQTSVIKGNLHVKFDYE